MKLIEFIQEHEDWKERLEAAPYHLTIRESGNLVLFKYNQIDSDFSEPIVQESRGIILERGTWKIVCHPFHKFFNYGEGFAADIDWDSAQVQSKEDGSLIKVYFYNGAWKVATNGTIDAFEAPIEAPFSKVETFGELFMYTLKKLLHDESRLFSQLDKEYTHLFELCTPYNRVVVPYRDFQLFYLGSKHNETGHEEIQQWAIPKPRSYRLNSLEDILEMAETLSYDEEGYVVVDKDLNRIKIKSPAYLAAHRLKGEGVVTTRKVLGMLLIGEQSEFLSYFPEYQEKFDEVQGALDSFIKTIEKDIEEAKKYSVQSRKEFALWAKEQFMPSILFAWLDGKVDDVNAYVKEMGENKVEKFVEKFLEK